LIVPDKFFSNQIKQVFHGYCMYVCVLLKCTKTGFCNAADVGNLRRGGLHQFLYQSCKCTICIKLVLMFQLDKTDSKTSFSTSPGMIMKSSSKVVRASGHHIHASSSHWYCKQLFRKNMKHFKNILETDILL
jgi:hypothetical protein